MTSTARPLKISDPEVLKLLKEVAKENGLKDYKIDHSEGKTKGEGYMGEITLVKISGTDSHNKRKTMDLVIKRAAKSENLRNQAPVSDIYGREIYMYNTIFPLFRKFELDKGVDKPFSNYPKCYKTSMVDKNEMLIMENLNPKGYVVWNRRLHFTDEHVRLVYNTLGHLHAISFAMRDQQPEMIAIHTKDWTNMLKKFTETCDFVGMITTKLNKVKAALEAANQLEAAKKLGKFSDGMNEFLEEAYGMVDQHTAILHGDNWINNMLFKSGDPSNPTKPTDIVLIDFQISRPGIPVMDLSYCFYVGATKSMMDNIDEYLHVYHQSLSKHLEQLGSNVNELYPFSVLQDQWKKYAKFGLCMAAIVVHIMLAEADEALDIAEEADSGKSLTDSFEYDIREQAEYNRRMTDVVVHFAEKGFI